MRGEGGEGGGRGGGREWEGGMKGDEAHITDMWCVSSRTLA